MFELFGKLALNKDSELNSVVLLSIKIILTIFISIKLYAYWIGGSWLNSIPSFEEIYKWIISGEVILGIGLYFLVWLMFYEVVKLVLMLFPFWLLKKIDSNVETIFGSFKNMSQKKVEEIIASPGFSTLKAWGLISSKDKKLKPGWFILNMAQDVKKDVMESDNEKKYLKYIDPRIPIHFLCSIVFVQSLYQLPYWLHLIGLLFLLLYFLFGMLSTFMGLFIDKYKRELLLLAEEELLE